MPLWIWLLGLLWIVAATVVWSALKMASLCDDQQARLLREERQRAALGRAAASASNVTPIRRHTA